MKLVNHNRQISIDLECGEPFFLVVEAAGELRRIISDLYMSICDDTEDWVLSEGEEIQKKKAVTEMVFSPWMININNKRIQKELIKRIIYLINQGVENERAQNIFSEIRIFLDNISEEINPGLEYDIEDISELLKICNIRLEEEDDILSRLSNYIKTCAELLNIKLFVFVGMKNYFTSEELGILAKEAGYMGCYILYIENTCEESDKNVILIDKDLCRIV